MLVEPENSSSAASERDCASAPPAAGKLAAGESMPDLPGDAPRFPGELKLGELELPQPASVQARAVAGALGDGVG